MSAGARPLPWFGWVGLVLVGAGQLLTLWHWRPLSDHWYGLCWTGVTLLADAWLFRCSGRCLLRDRRGDVLLMLVVSAACWWGLEHANHAMQAWSYSPSPDVPAWQQRLRATLFFATLVPATWAAGLAALAWRPWRALTGGPRLPAGPRARLLLALAGAACLLSAPWLVHVALGLILLGLLLLLDPLNHWRGRPSLIAAMGEGDYRVPVVFAGATMATGVVGEMWNYPASPRWTYDVPYIGFAYVFEMPLLGFVGYGLLALTVFAVYHFVRGFVLAPGRDRTAGDALALAGLG